MVLSLVAAVVLIGAGLAGLAPPGRPIAERGLSILVIQDCPYFTEGSESS
jgi:hypothetical protein